MFLFVSEIPEEHTSLVSSLVLFANSSYEGIFKSNFPNSCRRTYSEVIPVNSSLTKRR